MSSNSHASASTTSVANFGVKEKLRALPSVRALCEHPTAAEQQAALGDAALTRAARHVLDVARAAILAEGADAPSLETLADALRAQLDNDKRGSLRPVLNGTGVIVHTNLGRAPLAAEAIAAAQEIGADYSTLEFDLDTGKRGSRHGHVKALLQELCHAEDACVVNNNAAAVLLALSAIAAGQSVIVSRGELVEIGGGFRVPDVMQQGGAKVVEVGTTNRTHPRDFAGTIDDATGAVLKVHQSNFATVGFTRSCSIAELRTAIDESPHPQTPLFYDAGSGCLRRIAAAPEEHTIAECIDAGADLVMFSGDKLLGGPQAGIIAGRADLVEKCRRHPLMRAMRPDKMCLAALDATLRLWRDRPEAVPVRRMIDSTGDELDARAERLLDAVKAAAISAGGGCERVRTTGKIGGGTSPLVELPSAAVRLAVPNATSLLATLRSFTPPLIGRLEDDALLIDVLTLPPEQDAVVAAHLVAALDRRRPSDTSHGG